jgi:CRP/FNR family transcriptional regulator, cyclic AMP receptor protein
MNWLDLFHSHAADAEEFTAGEWIYREGEEGTLLFVLLSGAAELSRRGATIARLEAPDFFGEAASLGIPCRCDSARAVSAVRVLPIGPARLTALAEKHPTFHTVLADAFTRRGETRFESDERRHSAARS